MHRNNSPRQQACKRTVAVLAFALAATACNDELTEPQVVPASEPASGGANALAAGAGDRAVLVALYKATHGPGWDESDNWLTDAPLHEWHGVETDGSGRVQILGLSGNNLVGGIPSELSGLANLRSLWLDNNSLSGGLPPEFADLSLNRLTWHNNAGLCGSGTRRFISFVKTLYESSEGPFCHEVDADVLRYVHHSTGGRAWTQAEGWLLPGPLDDWHGVEVDTVFGRVVGLDLRENNLSGRYPNTLASLDSLRNLRLDGNTRLGGRLSSVMTLLPLQTLSYKGTSLCTPEEPAVRAWLHSIRHHSGTSIKCPPLTERDVLEVLFDATRGRDWSSSYNWLTNPSLHLWRGVDVDVVSGHVQRLDLSGNGLVGGIPSELGSLTNLQYLDLSGNGLVGGIPSELGSLTNLQYLGLSGNDLVGGVPSELGSLSNLVDLRLFGNADLFGVLPRSFTNLTRLQMFSLGGTALCAPNDFAFLLWLRSMWQKNQTYNYYTFSRTYSRYVPICKALERASTATAYVVQGVQSANVPVPLVAGKRGLLRVLVAAPDAAGGTSVPAAWATFYQRDGSKHNVRVRSGGRAIPAEVEVAEGSLTQSANVEVPGEVLRPGVKMVVVLDPDVQLDPALGVPRRIPATGRMALDVHEMPSFDITVVPFLWETEPDSSILNVTDGLTADAPLFEETWLLPVGEMSVTVHEPVWTSTNNAFDLLDETHAIRLMEGGTSYYMGTMADLTGASGVAGVGGKSMVAIPSAEVVAHEFGHNFGLWHAPCGRPLTVDPGFPHSNGRIGVWGYDHRSRQLVSPFSKDIMSYCDPSPGFSDYSFARAYWKRLWGFGVNTGAVVVEEHQPTRALLLWGGVGVDGHPFLNPAFVVDARPTRLDGTGAWQIAGEAEDGRVLFNRRFEMSEMADGEGRESFTLALAGESSWADQLSRIVLTGPDGAVAMDSGPGPAAVMLLRDSATGRVRGILRDVVQFGGGGALGRARALLVPGLEVQVSAGVPRPDAWRR